MRKLIYKLYIGSYNNKFHAYVHMRCQTFKIIKKCEYHKNIICFKKKDKGIPVYGIVT